MIRLGALRETITIHTYSESGTDDYGNPVKTFSSGTDARAGVEPFRLTYERLSAEDRREERLKVLVAADTVVTGLDRITWRSVLYEVDGRVQDFTYRNGLHHREFVLKIVEGG